MAFDMSGTYDTSGALDEALERLHGCGPEFEGWLTNHGPMAVEVLARRGRAGSVHRWLDAYEKRLEELPAPGERITDATWQAALGDPRRLGDWPVYFAEKLAERPWRDVLAEWWPRLLPGLAGGATHVVIRAGHAVRALLDEEAAGSAPTAPRVAELAHALAYWAARYYPLPVVAEPAGAASAADAVAGVPPVPEQTGGILARLDQLTTAPGWTAAVGALRPATTADGAQAALADLVRASAHRYATHAHGSPVMLVHAVTAPNAVLRTLPALPRELWAPSYESAWLASAAVLAAYVPPSAMAPHSVTADAQELFSRAVENGDEHAIKLADTALDVADDGARAAMARAVELIPPVG
jgi:Questin oxidase-like